jgi:hypothetical protein
VLQSRWTGVAITGLCAHRSHDVLYSASAGRARRSVSRRGILRRILDTILGPGVGFRNGLELCHAVAGGVTLGNCLSLHHGGLLGKSDFETQWTMGRTLLLMEDNSLGARHHTQCRMGHDISRLDRDHQFLRGQRLRRG